MKRHRAKSIILFFILLPSVVTFAQKQKEQPPNILFLLSDDHSVPFLGAYGYPIKTPVIDQLAREGVLFDKAFTAAPQCVPSRAAIMTGRSPVAIQMTRFNAPLPNQYVTLPQVLRKAGYFTGVAKRYYHLDGPNYGRDTINQRVIDKYNLRTFKNAFDFVQVDGKREETPQVVNEYFDKVPKGKPFFLWVNFYDPHHAWDKDAVSKPLDPTTLPLPDYLPDYPSVRQALADHCGEIMRMDEEVKWILDILEKRDLSKNTIIVFMGDNGMAFPSGKGSLHDTGLNVPLIIKGPSNLVNPSRTNALFSGEDLAPTLIDMAGLKVPEEMTGISFKKLLKGEQMNEREYIFAERGPHSSASYTATIPSSGVDYARCVRSKQYKLIYTITPFQRYVPVDSSNDPYWKEIEEANKNGTLDKKFQNAYFQMPRPVYELYDLENDPAELNNLADDPLYTATFNKLQAALLEKMVVDGDYVALPHERRDPGTIPEKR